MLCDSNETDNKRRYHRLRGSGSTVVTMTSKVNRAMEILIPCRSETPKNIKTRIGQNDYVMGGWARSTCQFSYKSVQGGLLSI